jgi:hypothetical protein
MVNKKILKPKAPPNPCLSDSIGDSQIFNKKIQFIQNDSFPLLSPFKN